MTMMAAAAVTGAYRSAATGALPGTSASTLEELTHFRKWSIFLPCAASSDITQNGVYVRARFSGNPRFFEQARERLERVLYDRNLVKNVSPSDADADARQMEVIQALDLVLQAQWTALGFVCDRQFHKALALGELSVAIVDTLAATWQWASADAVFWKLLVRANLGGTQARFGKHDEATSVLRQGLQMAEGATLGARERVLLGVLYAHLVRVCLDAGDLNEASRLAESEIEAFERHIWELSDAREDREIQALVLATSYMTRGLCDIRKKKYDTGQMWFSRAQECVEKHADLGSDSSELLAQIVEQAEHCRSLQL